MEVARLQNDLQASDDENIYLKRDLDRANAKIISLQQDLDDKANLLSAIGAYA
jgi:hypothetical protein